ncbi:MAG TPA: response regulator [Candidatus Saccharimonadales bacterium]|jgi:CheY-like chemotaxis protein|nr:response regulator [Candidatus Saccharimonadales bacterium]
MTAKIMLVEDDTNLSEIYKARLEAEGYEILSAKDGEEALAMAVKNHPDLIISDIMMPKISGFDMLDILRGTPGIEATKVIMMTALGQSEDKSRAEKLGADRYLVKSQVTLEDVIKTVHEVLEGGTPEETSMLQADISSSPSQPAVPLTPATPVLITPMPVTPAPTATPAAVTPEPPLPAPIAATPAVPVAEPSPPQPTDQPSSVIPAPVVGNGSMPPLDTSSPSPTPLDASAPLSTLLPAENTDSSMIDSSLGQSSKEESSTIKSQIQNFLNPTPADGVAPAPIPTPDAPAVVVAPQSDSTPTSVGTSNDTLAQPESGSVNINGKKVIPTDSLKRPDIYSLLAKEEASSQTTPQQEESETIDPNSIAL